MTESKALYGRNVIYTSVSDIDGSNVSDIVATAYQQHQKNSSDIQYLYDYYRGKQPILNRTKKYNSEICNKVVENRANEIVSFKVGYLMGEPIQYVNRTGNDQTSENINILNNYVFSIGKDSLDKELADWFTICGTSYRIVLPSDNADETGSPFVCYTLDPRNTFVVYHTGLGNRPVMAVTYITNSDNQTVFSVYTDQYYFEIIDNVVVKTEYNTIGVIPIVEYPANSARLGAFEIVIPLLDAVNEVASNRIDGVEQFIQSLLVIKGVSVEDGSMSKLREEGGLGLPAEGDAKYLTQELNQMQTQTLVDYLYQTILTICGMPNRNGGSSTSDTGSAVIMRDGWSAAEARAKDTESIFRKSEKQFLKIALKIANAVSSISLSPSDVEIRFTRRNYENILEKSQVLTTLLANDKIHPKLAFEHSGMFTDANLAYTESMEYYKEYLASVEDELTGHTHDYEEQI